MLCALVSFLGAALADVPPVPVPAENPITEPKRVLGKVLFWDEQLSSDDTVACGTCHLPAHGGSDPRTGRHPRAPIRGRLTMFSAPRA
jgi:cytochrome c peroxidase